MAYTDEQRACISEHVAAKIAEGLPQDQAIAAAIQMCAEAKAQMARLAEHSALADLIAGAVDRAAKAGAVDPAVVWAQAQAAATLTPEQLTTLQAGHPSTLSPDQIAGLARALDLPEDEIRAALMADEDKDEEDEMKPKAEMKPEPKAAGMARPQPCGCGAAGRAATLEARLSRLEAERHAREASDGVALLERLRQDSADAQAPIPEERLARVSALWAAGQQDAAREVGAALLETARARGTQAGVGLSSLSPSREAARTRAVTDAKGAMLEVLGHQVERDKDGHVTRCERTPLARS
jgi:hypothetical protein